MEPGILYLTTLTTPGSKAILEKCLESLMLAIDGNQPPASLYQLYYEQAIGTPESKSDGRAYDFPALSPNLAFDDATLRPVQEAWRLVMGQDGEEAVVDYMTFQDREGVGDDDES